MEIREQTIASAWPLILTKILKEGMPRIVRHNNAKIIELIEPIVVVIEHPSEHMIPEKSGWTTKILDIYASQVFQPEKLGFAYSYGERLNRMDQINAAIRKLNEDEVTKQAVAITWIPEVDNCSVNPPCLQIVDFKIYNGKLTTVAYFRSNDMYAAWPQNAYLLVRLAQHVSRKTIGHSNIGPLTIISAGAHIYQNQIEDAKRALIVEIKNDNQSEYFAAS